MFEFEVVKQQSAVAACPEHIQVQARLWRRVVICPQAVHPAATLPAQVNGHYQTVLCKLISHINK